MEISRKAFLSSWEKELKSTHPLSILPSFGDSHGALSAHLMSKDDTTVFGKLVLLVLLDIYAIDYCHQFTIGMVKIFPESDPNNSGVNVIRCLIVGSAIEIALSAAYILGLQVSCRAIVIFKKCQFL